MGKLLMTGIALLSILGGILFISADHIDAPQVSGTSSDIADYYAFQSPTNNSNMVFVITMQGLLSPTMTSTSHSDENILTEVNIDNDGDNVEDLVIQFIPRDGRMYAFGPYTPSATGLSSSIDDSEESIDVNITNYGQNPIISSKSGKQLFAGPRDDPFFFDLGAYSAILSGSSPSFDNPGNDTFAGTNVIAVVIEFPKSSLGNSTSVNSWVETKLRS